MKSLITLVLAIFSFQFSLLGQVQNPVKWSAEYKSINDQEGEVIIRAEIDKGWHTYSQRPTDAGPIPTSITLVADKKVELVGKVTESEAHEEFVKAFEAKIFVFTEKAEFKQKVKLKSKSPVTLNVKVEYMCCNDLMCLPPKTIDLSVVTKK